jgi:AcrR family transcriptional regulator
MAGRASGHIEAARQTPQGFTYRARPAVRMTQAEKAAESRRRVLDAALSCLIDRGYANTTTLEIAARAGLSRGSQLYHFPKKDALLTSAVGYLIELRLAEIRRRLTSLPAGVDRWAEIVRALWEAWEGPLSFAWMELAVASRTDARLRKAVTAMNQQVNDFVIGMVEEVVEPPPQSRERFRVAVWALMFLFSSMVLERSVGDFDRVDDMISLIESIGRAAQAAPGKSTGRKKN